jgi:poly(A) polymerase
MMRAVEFASRLGFAITPDAYEAILAPPQGDREVGAARVTEELAQACAAGTRIPTLLLMREVGLLDALLPELASVLRQIESGPSARHRPPLLGAPGCPGRRERRGRVFDDAVLFSLFFLPVVRSRLREMKVSDPEPGRFLTILEEIVTPVSIRMSLPNAVSHRIKQALAIVGRLRTGPTGGSRPGGSLSAKRSRSRSISSS